MSPAYFSGAVQLGTLTQTASAFSSVQESLSFFVTFYRSIAEWAAVVDRLTGFNRALDEAQTMAASVEHRRHVRSGRALHPHRRLVG